MEVLLNNKSLENYFIIGLIIVLSLVFLLLFKKNINNNKRFIGIAALVFIPPIGIIYSMYLIFISQKSYIK